MHGLQSLWVVSVPRCIQLPTLLGVIGYFPGYASYIPGVVVRRNEDCWQGAYHVKFDTGEECQLDFNEIRILPPYVQLVF